MTAKALVHFCFIIGLPLEASVVSTNSIGVKASAVLWIAFETWDKPSQRVSISQVARVPDIQPSLLNLETFAQQSMCRTCHRRLHWFV